MKFLHANLEKWELPRSSKMKQLLSKQYSGLDHSLPRAHSRSASTKGVRIAGTDKSSKYDKDTQNHLLDLTARDGVFSFNVVLARSVSIGLIMVTCAEGQHHVMFLRPTREKADYPWQKQLIRL